MRNVIDNKSFWRKVEPFLFRKSKYANKNTPVEKREISDDVENILEIETVVSDNGKVAETFNNTLLYFLNSVPSLKILPKENYDADIGNENKPILKYINKSGNHSGIKLKKSKK